VKANSVGRTTLLVSLLLIVGVTVMAQPGPERATTVAKAGPWALLFRVTSNFTIAPLTGTEVWVQRSFVGGDAVRLGAGISANSGSGTMYHRLNGDTVDVSIAADYVHYISRDNELSVILGAGPTVDIWSMSSFESGQETEDSVVVSREWRTEQDIWSAGAEVILGAEWRLTRHIGVSAEYGLSAQYSNRKDHRHWKRRAGDGPWETTLDDHPHTEGWSVGDMTTRLGLTIYL